LRENTFNWIELRAVGNIEDKLDVKFFIDILDYVHLMDCQVVHVNSQRNSRILEPDVLYKLDEVGVLPSFI
jgi:hypothetical protein